MEKYLALIDTFFDDVVLREVRHLTDEEKKHYIPELHDWLFMPTGERESYTLKNKLEPGELPDISRRSGQFHYGSNNLFIITEEEWQHYVELDKKRTEEKKKAAEAAAAAAPAIKHDAEKERAYDVQYNEGGEGYNPYRLGSTPTYWRGRRTQEDPITD